MFGLLKASFFKLKRDLTLRVTLIIGLALAVFLSFLYFIIDSSFQAGYHVTGTGQNMLLNSFSPVQNFGIAIPINLVIFTILEFNQGTIRNKIVVGNSKFKIYISLLITGLLFTFALLISYVGISTILGCIFGRGFFPNYQGEENVENMMRLVKEATASGDYIVKFVVGGLLTYITITCYTVFCATLLRNVGPSIPLVLVPTIILTMLPLILGTLASEYPRLLEAARQAQENHSTDDFEMFMAQAESFKTIYYVDQFVQNVNPFYLIGSSSLTSLLGATQSIPNSMFVKCICSNIVWSIIFTVFGALIFCKRDLK